MTLPKDLREMSEEQFLLTLNYIKCKTCSFQQFPPELFIENNKYLFVIRCVLGLSQKELADRLGCTKDWVRHTEAGRNKIEDIKIAQRWISKIEELMKNTEMSLENTLNFWKRIQFSREQILPEIKKTRKTIFKITENELIEWFDEVKNKTNNFTKFDSKILIENPQNILIFRLALGIDHRKFAGMTGYNSRTIRKWEHLEMKMKSQTAEDVINKIKAFFSETDIKIDVDKFIFNFRSFTNKFGNRNLASSFKRGLSFAKNQDLSPNEKEILDTLQKSKIQVEPHAIVQGLKRDFNVDFVIPDSKNPKILIESFDFSLNSKTVSHSKTRVCHVDHRFQMMKGKNKNIKTFLFIRFLGRPIHEELAKKSLEMEIVNTDFLVINHFEKLLSLIKQNLN